MFILMERFVYFDFHNN